MLKTAAASLQIVYQEEYIETLVVLDCLLTSIFTFLGFPIYSPGSAIVLSNLSQLHVDIA